MSNQEHGEDGHAQPQARQRVGAAWPVARQDAARESASTRPSMLSVPPVPSASMRTAGTMVRRAGKTRNPWGVWLLSLVTFGIYALWWYYKVNAEVRDYDERIQVQPGVAVLALLSSGFTFGISAIVSMVKTGGRISQAQRAAGSNDRCSGLVGLLLSVVGFGVVYYQSQVNKVWDQHGNPEPGTVVS